MTKSFKLMHWPLPYSNASTLCGKGNVEYYDDGTPREFGSLGYRVEDVTCPQCLRIEGHRRVKDAQAKMEQANKLLQRAIWFDPEP